MVSQRFVHGDSVIRLFGYTVIRLFVRVFGCTVARLLGCSVARLLGSSVAVVRCLEFSRVVRVVGGLFGLWSFCSFGRFVSYLGCSVARLLGS